MKVNLVIILMGAPFLTVAQPAAPGKEVTTYTQSWYSINSTFRFSNRWGMVADYHVRRDNFMKDQYFYFVRLGGIYWVADKYPVIAGVAHLWLAPAPGNNTWSNENRIYQQWSGVTRQGQVTVLNRLRFEQRWRDQIVNDEAVGNKQFSLRLRYLASFEIQLLQDPKLPSLAVSDELLAQFGNNIAYNSFDQNRLFLGLKMPLSQKLNFDIGYMNILQQKPSGYQYDLSNVFRLFFYFNMDFTKNKHQQDQMDDAE